MPSQNVAKTNTIDSNKLATNNDVVRSNSFGGTSPNMDISQNQYSSFNSAAKPLVLSSKSKNGADLGWGDWGNDLLDDANIVKPNGSSGLGPILQPDRSKLSNISKKPSSLATSKGSPMADWSAGNEDWGWSEPTVPKQEQRKPSIKSLNPGPSNIVTDDWNSGPGDDWNSWAEPTPSPSQKVGTNDWGSSWSPSSNTSISIEKLKGENRKQRLQESREKNSQSRGKNY